MKILGAGSGEWGMGNIFLAPHSRFLTPHSRYSSEELNRMPSQKQPSQPRSTEEILREMEDMARESGSDRPAKSSGGGLKSFLDFFVKFDPEEPEGEPGAGAPKPKSTAAHSKQDPVAAPRVREDRKSVV